MEIKDYEVILDSMRSTGIYVIREDDHQILYFNQRVKEIKPDICEGMVCHELWPSGCPNCPLLYIGNKRESKAIHYGSPFGNAVEVTATRILWEDTIPAVVITVIPHREMASYTYKKILKANLTLDTVEINKSDGAEILKDGHPETSLESMFSDFVEMGNVYGKDVERFRNFARLSYLREELRSGKEMLICTYRRRTDDGFRWHTMEVIPDYSYTEENQSVMLYVKDVHDIYREGLEQEEINIRNREIITSLGELNYGIYVIDLHTGSMHPVRMPDDLKEMEKKEYLEWDVVLVAAVNQYFHPESREKILETYSLKALREAWDRKERKKEILCRRKLNGKYRYISVTAHFHDSGEERGSVVMAFQDVDEQTQKEIKNYHIINTMSGLFFATYYIDLEAGTFRSITQKKEVGEILGAEENCVEGFRKYAEHFVHPEDRQEYLEKMNCGYLKETLSEKQPILAVEYRKIKDGDGADMEESSWIRANVILAESREEEAVKVLYVAQDVTESKQKEERERRILQEACDAANHANASKSEFLSRMSHDIRTPMNAIIGMTSIAGAHLDDRDRVSDCLGKITVSSKHLLSLINEVLDMSKIESGKINLAEEEFSLSDLADNVLTIVRPSMEAKEHEVEFRVGKLEHEDVIGDEMRLQQVLINIVGNAVKYTPQCGHLELELSEKQSSLLGYGCYEFSVKDNGIGMSPEFLKKIFDPFSRAEDSRISKIEGTGLGMAIALNIARKMNGDISVESKVGEGSKFTVTVYLKQQNVTLPDTKRLVDLPVLVVDDDRDACETVCMVLDDIGMKSEFVQSGREAVERVTKSHQEGNDFFAVILDWKMPEMDGLETAKQIRKQVDGDVPIIILSAYDWSGIENEARQAGVTGFISKPLFKSRLVYLFRQIVGEECGSQPDGTEKVSETDFHGKRILLVEDNELNREIAEEIIGSFGVTVETASNGRKAVDKFREMGAGYYDLIFMDVQMPVMNGYEASKEIRGLPQADAADIPIIAMTANAFAEDVAESRKAGMSEHITKPLDIGQLKNCMGYWLGK